jgi:glycosyltransferase involved in cell wall biosynthesis
MSETGIGGYDVIHSMADPWFINLGLLSKSPRCKWVHTYHLLFFKEDYLEGLQPWQEEANTALIEVASKADVRISTSKWLQDYLAQKYSIQTVVVMGAIDIALCSNSRAERFIKKYGFDDFVLFVGSIREVKNPPLFVKLAEQIPEYRFVMIGPDLNQARLKERYGITIPENVILLDKMERRDVLDAMAACKAYVLTSKHEGFPQVILEAMAIGKPVVVSSYMGSKEIVPSDDYGFLYDANSLDQLVQRTRQALASKDVGERAKERVSLHYDWKILAKEIDKLYES